jgi:glycosyltransferase involved in cell wall biosynthesis
MNILWVTNVAIPVASLLMKQKAQHFGGWLVSASSALAEQEEVKLSIAFPRKDIDNVQVYYGAGIKFYAFPSISEKSLTNQKTNSLFINILEEAKPDIVHIFGTEYAHTLSMVHACKEQNKKTVISIQGLVSIYAQHYMASLPPYVQSRVTLRNFLKQDNLKQQQKKFIRLGKLEIAALRQVKHIIGRTTWDRACSFHINPYARYHHCNEILRDEFYKHTWSLQQCENHSIFLSQASYPIKGLHYMLEAMPLILEHYPDSKLYVAGNNITKTATLKDKLKLSSYGKYIKELVKRFNLQKKVIFTGLLDEKKMCERYLKSHVFVCPSSIENSPNSLGEAMALGVPCVASNVGGVSDLLRHNEEGFLYQANAPYMLAHFVCEIFKDDNLALNFSKKAREYALFTHDSKTNTNRLIEIYNRILETRE